MDWRAPSHYRNQCWNIVNWTLRTNSSEISIEIYTFSLRKINLKMSSGNCGHFGLASIDTWGPHVIIATFYVWMSKLSEGYIFRFFSLGQTPKYFGRHYRSALVRGMTCRLLGSKPFNETKDIDMGDINIDNNVDTGKCMGMAHRHWYRHKNGHFLTQRNVDFFRISNVIHANPITCWNTWCPQFTDWWLCSKETPQNCF